MYEQVDIVLDTVCIVTRLQAGQPRSWGLIPSRGKRFFLLCNVHTLSRGPTQHHIQWVLEAVSPGLKLLGYEADHSPLSGPKVKNDGDIPPPHIHLHGMVLD
jgi:hypothetical protein